MYIDVPSRVSGAQALIEFLGSHFFSPRRRTGSLSLLPNELHMHHWLLVLIRSPNIKLLGKQMYVLWLPARQPPYSDSGIFSAIRSSGLLPYNTDFGVPLLGRFMTLDQVVFIRLKLQLVPIFA